MDGTLKEDVLAALVKERNRLNAVAKLDDEGENRLSMCVEYIKRIRLSDDYRPATLSVNNPWMEPLKL